jgi:hypothetical protein
MCWDLQRRTCNSYISLLNKMKGHLYLLMVLLTALFSLCCQKEISFEGGNLQQKAIGTLTAGVLQECLPKEVLGNYVAAATLTATNSIEVQVNIDSAGSYIIYTDTINGYSFSATGNFSSTGIQSVKLSGNGTPLGQGTNIFQVKFRHSSCIVAIVVQAAGGTGQAEFTLQGAGGNCLDYTVNGTYTSNQPLGASNTVAIKVNITKIGSYSISTNLTNGITFTAGGSFTNTGIQTIILSGTGTPENAGSTSISISAGISTCNFIVDITPLSGNDFFPRTANCFWVYEIDNNVADTARFFAISSLHNALGNVYNIVMVTAGITVDTAGYYRKSGNDYFQYMDMGDFIGFDQPVWGEYIFLKDTAAGVNWKSAGFSGTVTIAPLPPQPLTIRFNNTILQRDATVSVVTRAGSVIHTGVIVVEEKYERFQAGSWVDITPEVGSLRKYFKNNVGLIKHERIYSTGNVAALFELKNYQVF